MAVSMSIQINQGNYKGWDAYWIVHGSLTLILVPQVGGRIMGMQWHGQELAFINADLEGHVKHIATAQNVLACKRDLGFLLWGGDKTWLAPQEAWSDELPFLDLDSGAYKIEIERPNPDGATLRMTSPICRETGVQISRTVNVKAGEAGWTVLHRLHNRSDREVRWAPWDVSMVRRPARVYLPRRQDSRYRNGVKTFDNEGESTTVRDAVVSDLGDLAAIRCVEPRKFKFGVDADLGSILAIVDVEDFGLVGYRKNVPTFHSQLYGHGCVAEVFNSSDYPYFEMELHGPVVNLKPAGNFELREQAILFDVPTWPKSASEVQKYLKS